MDTGVIILNILVSACLLGINCRYDGKDNKVEEILSILEKHNIIPICPEQLGGLTTPREPSEIVNGKVMSKSGVDVNEEFEKGAEEALKLSKMFNSSIAILKARSPSCGSIQVYDGNFNGSLIDGEGVTARLFRENGIEIFDEEHLDELRILLEKE
ncbi:MAG: DUF523 domain-containing protein [Tissierellia bacterium]|nr:DUF523 domain-containing protein [Tissierellia bacterium]